MTNCWGIDDYDGQVYMGQHSIGWMDVPSNWKTDKPELPLEQTFGLRFSADWTKERCKLSIWYNDNLLGNISDDDGTNYTFLLPQLSDQHHWYPCATPFNKNAWVKIKYL